ncbi:MOSC domain-containing protein [Geminocystis herdmanii]|uniref:MOSC domain-containing protein n=1 Tax=Geminocystis herdmanii TaxID=669359 RepID=UPI00034D4C78|nr:MOSC N-terminal beta barrel domain-containing protein [Geminocystis herdmanii]
MKISHLFIYPIKSCQGISLTKAQITVKGLKNFYQPAFFDREFMLVDENGKFLTQRQYPNMATIKVEIQDKKIYLSTKNNNLKDFELTPLESNQEISVNIWRDTTIAIDQGDEVAKWLNQALNLEKSCRLVRQSSQYIRAINHEYSTAKNQPVSFADGFPYLLTNTASLADLNHRLKVKYDDDFPLIKMGRFRSNIVVETSEPFIEDTWQKITINNVSFQVVKPCSRCVITTTDQYTGKLDRTKEPLLTLSTFRNTPDGIMFGQNMIPDTEGIISIGDIISSKI